MSKAEFATVEKRERAELGQRARRLRGKHPRISMEGRTVVVVDDGIATGSTARAACQVARGHGAARVILAVPVAPRSTVKSLSGYADEVICVVTPEPFFGVGQFYSDFSQIKDAEVVELLEGFADRLNARPPADSANATAVDPPVRRRGGFGGSSVPEFLRHHTSVGGV